MKIGNVELPREAVLLAPMEDVTDPAFRLMCKQFGADMVYTEFVSADALIRSVSKTEQKLLRILIENRGQTLSRSTLVDRIWTDGAEFVDENALSVTVKRLRSKLEDTPSSPQYLKTVYGIGYTWAVK